MVNARREEVVVLILSDEEARVLFEVLGKLKEVDELAAETIDNIYNALDVTIND